MKQKLLSLVLAVGMLAALAVPAMAVGTGFPDVPEQHWAARQIGQACQTGLFNGYPDGTFHPDQAITGAEFMSVLVNHYCKKDINVDMAHMCGISGRWYDGLFYAADKNHYLKGLPFDDGYTQVLDAEAPRELLVAMMYNLAGRPEVEEGALDGYTDRDEISEYALPGFGWAVRSGVISGTSATTLSPKGTATRATVAVILIRYIENIEGPLPDNEHRNADGTTNADYVNSVSNVKKDAAYPTTGAAAAPNANGYYTEANVDIEGCTLQYDALAYMNEFLEEQGYPSVMWTTSDEVEEYSMMRAKEAYSNFAHERPDGSSIIAVENLYKGNSGASIVIKAWANSQGHNRTMRACAGNYICIARYKNCWVLTGWKEGSDQLTRITDFSSNNYYYFK